MNRRRFLKYAGATAAVVGASALGLNYVLNPRQLSGNQTTTPPSSTLTSRPEILNLEWNPSEVTNSKVYDGSVSFQVDSESVPLAVEIDFNPSSPSEIPIAAIPQESPRTYNLTSNSTSATLSQPITNLIGGKKYTSVVTAKDSRGLEAQSALDITYVREFEKLSANLNLGAYYLPWRNLADPTRSDMQQMRSELSAIGLAPLLGYYGYRTYDPFFINKQIDWSTGYKIGHWLNSFWADSRLQLLLSQPLIQDIEIGIMYESADLLKVTNLNGWGLYNVSDPQNLATLEQHMTVLAETFFDNPQVWKINGNPVIELYWSHHFMGDVPNAIGHIRDVAQSYGFKPFIVGDEVWYYPTPAWSPDWLKSYDAITAHLLHGDSQAHVTDENYEEWLDTTFNDWSKRGKLIPFATPSFGPTFDQPDATIERSPSRFETRIEIAKKYVNSELDTLMITSFNDWADLSPVEPTTKEEFTYLQVVKDNF